MFTCWQCLKSFQSEQLLLEHLAKHSNGPDFVKGEYYDSDTVKTEGSDTCLDLNAEDSYNLSAECYKNEHSIMSQVMIQGVQSSASTIKSENSVKIESIDSVPTQPSTGAF
eukprot:226948_1